MSKRIDKSWGVFNSVEKGKHDSCVDIFYRPDGSFGFESFRRDFEDLGAWTPLCYFYSLSYASSEAAYAAAEAAVPWLSEVLIGRPTLRRHS